LRTTKDAGTLHIPLPGMSIPVHIGHVRNEIAWSLCGPLCPSGTLKGRKTPQNATGFQGTSTI
jgi:hypothetical protein